MTSRLFPQCHHGAIAHFGFNNRDSLCLNSCSLVHYIHWENTCKCNATVKHSNAHLLYIQLRKANFILLNNTSSFRNVKETLERYSVALLMITACLSPNENVVGCVFQMKGGY